MHSEALQVHSVKFHETVSVANVVTVDIFSFSESALLAK